MGAPLVLAVDASLMADRMLIGGKAESLVTLARLGAAVPAAFVLTTEAYRLWASGGDDSLLQSMIAEGMRGLEARTGRRFSDGANGLVVAVRSGAPVSMPGMMDTVLNAGLGSLGAPAEHFIIDARLRFLWQYAELVLGLDEASLEAIRAENAVVTDVESLARLEHHFEAAAAALGKIWPVTAMSEVVGAAHAVFKSWQSSRARLYRRMRKIDDTLGTTVTIQQMVFGNRDSRSGSGVAFTRSPADGAPGLHGEFLVGGQGEEVVAGRVAGTGLECWRDIQPALFEQLEALGHRLEAASRKVHEIEFTVEQGACFVLQCRPALLTARAAARVAVEMHQEGLLQRGEAVAVAASHGFDPAADPTGLVVPAGAAVAARGIPVGGGVAVGRVALTLAGAERLVRAGEPVVFVALETSPGLLSVMQRSAALVSMRGGATSHAAVVARELGTPCVVGLGCRLADDEVGTSPPLHEGDWVTVDGDSGAIHAGDVTVRASRLTSWEIRLRDWAAEESAGANTRRGAR